MGPPLYGGPVSTDWPDFRLPVSPSDLFRSSLGLKASQHGSKFMGSGKVHEAGGDEEYDYYIVHDSIGVSHVLKQKKGEPPSFGCRNCVD